MADALDKSHSLIMRELSKDKRIKPLLVVISDGRGNVSCYGGKPAEDTRQAAGLIAEAGYPAMVIDSETGFLKLGLAKKLADDMHCRYIALDDLRADSIMDAVASIDI